MPHGSLPLAGICVSAALSTGGFAFRFLDNTFRSTDVFNFDEAQLSQFFLFFMFFFVISENPL